ncbi:hypothetical protein [Microbacterium oleivorans]|uniref:ANTAR domain-containing protein n=1 Tax=Microbacterium oleivorans TaxID=273677 RepID=A0A4R5YJM3_9MICO|nr:hypothetical protein [Microbacterium oleivorans]TDL45594.1 hypothetical protein E2R54_03825 [Microbacterium oleivorans]
MDHPELRAARVAAFAAASALVEAVRAADAAIVEALANGATVDEVAAEMDLTYEVAERVAAGEVSFSSVLLAGLAEGWVPPSVDERVRRATAFANRSRMQ